MKRRIRKLLYDIQRAALLIAEFTASKTFADYERDAMLRAAVEREFVIIGEAVSRLASADQEMANNISEYQRMIAFRNILVHGYADVDNGLVWNIVEANLPKLIRTINVLLEQQ